MNIGRTITFENNCININGFVDGGKVIVLSKYEKDKKFHIEYIKAMPMNITVAKKYLEAYNQVFMHLDDLEYFK